MPGKQRQWKYHTVKLLLSYYSVLIGYHLIEQWMDAPLIHPSLCSPGVLHWSCLSGPKSTVKSDHSVKKWSQHRKVWMCALIPHWHPCLLKRKSSRKRESFSYAERQPVRLAVLKQFHPKLSDFICFFFFLFFICPGLCQPLAAQETESSFHWFGIP